MSYECEHPKPRKLREHVWWCEDCGAMNLSTDPLSPISGWVALDKWRVVAGEPVIRVIETEPGVRPVFGEPVHLVTRRELDQLEARIERRLENIELRLRELP